MGKIHKLFPSKHFSLIPLSSAESTSSVTLASQLSSQQAASTSSTTAVSSHEASSSNNIAFSQKDGHKRLRVNGSGLEDEQLVPTFSHRDQVENIVVSTADIDEAFSGNENKETDPKQPVAGPSGQLSQIVMIDAENGNQFQD